MWQTTVARLPRNAHAHFRRGFAWKSLGKLEEAAEDFERAKALDPDNPYLVLNYSQAHLTEFVILCPPGQEPEWPEQGQGQEEQEPF